MTLKKSLWMLMFGVLALPVFAAEKASKPATPVDTVEDTLHGVKIADPYRWLEDQESPQTRQWLKAQNEYTDALLENRPEREQIKKRLSALLSLDWVGAPVERGGRYFLTKKRGKDDLPILYWREGLKGKDKVFLDPHKLSKDHTVTAGFSDISEDGNLVAYSIRQGGQDETEIHLRDMESDKEFETFPRAKYGGFSLTKDKRGVYYTVRQSDGSPRGYYHAFGSDFKNDTLVFGEGLTPDKSLGMGVSDNGKYLLITVSHGWTKNDLYFKKLSTDAPIEPIVNDLEALTYGWFAGDVFVAQTDWNAPNKRLVAIDLKKPSKENWREIVPEGTEPIESFSLVGGKIYVKYLKDVNAEIRVYDLNGRSLGMIDSPGIGSMDPPDGRWDKRYGFFGFSSFATPSTVYRYDTQTGKRSIWYRLEVPFDRDAFEVKQVFYPSKDGTKVPMFLVHKKGLKLNGSNPTLLTGYGGFSASQTPYFSSGAVMWAEKGGVYAVANLRGGDEYGQEWHRAGMLANKQNTFDDFIAAGEWLVKNQYTSPNKLAIQGGSNGGLLVGAAMTQRPDLFRAVVCTYPLLDMLRFHKFLLGPLWVSEYGSAEDPEQFKWLYAYSPYQRVKPGVRYPATLFISGDNDTRVAPLHARKMAALMQTVDQPERPALLMYDTQAGHSGGKPLKKTIEDSSKQWAFLYWQLGVK